MMIMTCSNVLMTLSLHQCFCHKALHSRHFCYINDVTPLCAISNHPSFNHASIPCTLCHTTTSFPLLCDVNYVCSFFGCTIVQVFLCMYMWSVLFNKSWLLMMHGLTLKSFCWHLLISHHLLLHLAITFNHRHTMQRQTMNLFFVWQNKKLLRLRLLIHS